jgi:hypothetical protein
VDLWSLTTRGSFAETSELEVVLDGVQMYSKEVMMRLEKAARTRCVCA